MAVFRVERNKGYTVMSNHHLRNKELTLKAKWLLRRMQTAARGGKINECWEELKEGFFIPVLPHIALNTPSP